MANNGFVAGRQFPHPLVNRGQGYEQALQQRAQSILTTLQAILPSNYRAQTPSTEYAHHLKTMSIELGRLTLFLEDQVTDIDFEDVRGEYLYQIIGYLVFLNGRLPELDFTDEEFRNFLLAVIRIFFKGSTPAALREAVDLVLSVPFEIRENITDLRAGSSSYDISDQFGFQILLQGGQSIPPDFFREQANLQLLLDLIRPAHTLYRFSVLLTEGTPEDTVSQPSEALFGDLRWGQYEDTRFYCQGMQGFTSTQGAITALDTLEDSTAPLSRVRVHTKLTVLEGVNVGDYLVIESSGGQLKIHPRFKQVQSPVSYKVEVDRRGHNTEKAVTGEPVFVVSLA